MRSAFTVLAALVLTIFVSACGPPTPVEGYASGGGSTSNTLAADESSTSSSVPADSVDTTVPSVPTPPPSTSRGAGPLSYDGPPALTIDPSAQYTATITTNLGDIVIEFFADSAPQTVNNFLFLAQQGYYDGVIFHRVIPGFMIQGGDPTGTGRGGPGYSFADELTTPRAYNRGIVAMANSGPNTNGSQFFIMQADYGLPYSYTIFGEVTAGMEVVDAIAAIPTGPGDRPTTDVVIGSISVTGP